MLGLRTELDVHRLRWLVRWLLSPTWHRDRVWVEEGRLVVEAGGDLCLGLSLDG